MRRIRGALNAVAITALFAAGPALAAEKLVVMGHRVHQDAATKGPGGDVTAAWRTANNAEIEWITLGVDPLRERLFRELSLGETAVNIGFVPMPRPRRRSPSDSLPSTSTWRKRPLPISPVFRHPWSNR